MVNFDPLTTTVSWLNNVYPLEADIAPSAYANAFEFGPRDFATRGISTLKLFPGRIYGVGRTHVGLYPKLKFLCFDVS